jgi:hypothetical protein
MLWLVVFPIVISLAYMFDISDRVEWRILHLSSRSGRLARDALRTERVGCLMSILLSSN